MKSPLRILHLEDDLLDAELIKSTLEGEGIACKIFRVETRNDFVAAVDRGGFDIIFADYSLPGFDGLSALAIAKKDARICRLFSFPGLWAKNLPLKLSRAGLRICSEKQDFKASTIRTPGFERGTREVGTHEGS